MIKCLKFLIDHLCFWYNITYKPSCVLNKDEYQVYNEIYTDK